MRLQRPSDARAARHGVGILVHGVDRVGDGHDGIVAEQFLKIADIALGSVADEDFIRVELHPAGQKIVPEYGLAQKGVALFRAVAPEGVGAGHFVHGLVQGADDGGDEGQGHVAYAQADDFRFRVPRFEGRNPARHFTEEIIAGKARVGVVDACHGEAPDAFSGRAGGKSYATVRPAGKSMGSLFLMVHTPQGHTPAQMPQPVQRSGSET